MISESYGKTAGGHQYQGVDKDRQAPNPLISIITIVFNGAATLEQTILSVVEQNYPNLEYIIIDGGSTDGTLDIIKKYEDRIDYWVSEPDKGISDAFNKGIAHCHGELIGTLNSDDTYLPGTLRLVAEARVGEKSSQILHGAMIGVVHGKSSVISPRPCPALYLYIDVPYFHPTTFIPASVYDHIGGYDSTYHYAMDYDFFLRAHQAGVKFCRLQGTITRYSFAGKSGSNPLAAYREVLRSQRQHGLFYPLCLTTFLLKMAVNRLKRIFL